MFPAFAATVDAIGEAGLQDGSHRTGRTAVPGPVA